MFIEMPSDAVRRCQMPQIWRRGCLRRDSLVRWSPIHSTSIHLWTYCEDHGNGDAKDALLVFTLVPTAENNKEGDRNAFSYYFILYSGKKLVQTEKSSQSRKQRKCLIDIRWLLSVNLFKEKKNWGKALLWRARERAVGPWADPAEWSCSAAWWSWRSLSDCSVHSLTTTLFCWLWWRWWLWRWRWWRWRSLSDCSLHSLTTSLFRWLPWRWWSLTLLLRRWYEIMALYYVLKIDFNRNLSF